MFTFIAAYILFGIVIPCLFFRNDRKTTGTVVFVLSTIDIGLLILAMNNEWWGIFKLCIYCLPVPAVVILLLYFGSDIYLLELPESFKNRSKRKKDDSASKFYYDPKTYFKNAPICRQDMLSGIPQQSHEPLFLLQQMPKFHPACFLSVQQTECSASICKLNWRKALTVFQLQTAGSNELENTDGI
jgi:hypothetical protein